MMKYQRRWDDFRNRRDLIQDRYSILKKKQVLAESHVKQLFMLRFIKRIIRKFNEAKLKKTKDLKARFLTLRISQMWKRRRKRWGQYSADAWTKPPEDEFKKKSRFVFTFMSNGIYFEPIRKSKDCFKQFMEIQIEEEKMKMCFRAYYRKIVFM